MRLLIVGLASLAAFSFAFAQPPDTLWTAICDRDLWDDAEDMQQTADGGFIMAGWTAHGQFYDRGNVLVSKTDALGVEQWRFEHDHLLGDGVEGIHQIADGGYILGGWTNVGAGGSSMYMARLNGTGQLQWEREILEGGWCEAMTNEGDSLYLLAGEVNGEMALACADSSGNMRWVRTYPDAGFARAYGIAGTRDGSYMLAGRALNQSFDYVVAKVSSTGELIWLWSPDMGETEIAYDVQPTDDGGGVVVGDRYWYDGNGDLQAAIVVFWFNAYGDTLSSRMYRIRNFDEGFCLTRAADGGYLVGGSTQSWVPPYSFGNIVIRMNSQGDTLWTQVIPSRLQAGTYQKVVQLPEGGFAAAGWLWQLTDTTQADMFLARFGEERLNGAASQPIRQPDTYGLLAYPNPFNSSTEIRFNLPLATDVRLALFDVTGRFVKTLSERRLDAGTHRASLDGGGLASGTYFVRLQSPTSNPIAKLLLIR